MLGLPIPAITSLGPAASRVILAQDHLASVGYAGVGEALAEHYAERTTAGIDAYSARALARVWKAERFSWWFTGLTHRFPQTSGFDRRMQAAELAYIRGSRAAQVMLAENYVGLPLTN